VNNNPGKPLDWMRRDAAAYVAAEAAYRQAREDRLRAEQIEKDASNAMYVARNDLGNTVSKTSPRRVILLPDNVIVTVRYSSDNHCFVDVDKAI